MSCRSNSFFHEGFQNQNNDTNKNNQPKIMNQNNKQIVQTNNYKSKLNMKIIIYVILFLLVVGIIVYKNK